MTTEEFAIMTGQWVPFGGIPTLDDYSRALDEIHREEAVVASALQQVNAYNVFTSASICNDMTVSGRLAAAATNTILPSDGTDLRWATATGTGSPVRAMVPTGTHHLVELDYATWGDQKPR